MPLSYTMPVGTDGEIIVALRGKRQDIATQAPTLSTPYAEVSSGGSLPVLWVPQATWYDTTKAEILITLAAADTSQYDAGKYTIHTGVVVTATGQRFGGPTIDLTLTPSPSTTAITPLTDVTYRELLVYAPWLEKEKDGPQNSAGFLNERGLARVWLIEALLLWYSSWRSRCRLSEGWYYNAPTVAQMDIYLNDGTSLVVDSRIKEIEARKAISLVCETTLTPSDNADENQYRAVAVDMVNKANLKVSGLRVRIKNEADGVDLSFDDTVVKNNLRWSY